MYFDTNTRNMFLEKYGFFFYCCIRFYKLVIRYPFSHTTGARVQANTWCVTYIVSRVPRRNIISRWNRPTIRFVQHRSRFMSTSTRVRSKRYNYVQCRMINTLVVHIIGFQLNQSYINAVSWSFYSQAVRIGNFFCNFEKNHNNNATRKYTFKRVPNGFVDHKSHRAFVRFHRKQRKSRLKSIQTVCYKSRIETDRLPRRSYTETFFTLKTHYRKSAFTLHRVCQSKGVRWAYNRHN